MSFRQFWIVATICLGIPYQLSAQEMALAVIDGDYMPGSELEVALFVGNDTNSDYSAPRVLKAYLKQEVPYDYLPLELERLSEGSSSVASGKFGRFVYKTILPLELAASYYQLGIEGTKAEPLYVRIGQEALNSKLETDLIVASETNELKEEEVREQVASTLLDGVSTYKPIYFLFGNKPFDAKFQISLKYQLFNPSGDWAQNQNWLSGFYLGYSQTAFWDLAAASKPFEDTNFMPEAFYRVSDLKLSFLPERSHLDFQTGILHESNGRGGVDSRSLNILYSRATYEQLLSDGLFFRVTGDVWDYIGDLKDNPDIANFRGHSSIGLTVGAKKGIQFSSYRRGALTNNKASYLFDVTVPIKRLGAVKNLNFTLHGQLFTGYGENLLTYDEKETRVRFGLGIHR